MSAPPHLSTALRVSRPTRLFALGGLTLSGMLLGITMLLPSSAEQVRSAASGHLELLHSAQYSQAYSSLCALDQASMGPAAYVQEEKSAAEGRGTYRVDQVQLLSSREALVMVQVAGEDGALEPLVLPVVKENGTWRVCMKALDQQGPLVAV